MNFPSARSLKRSREQRAAAKTATHFYGPATSTMTITSQTLSEVKRLLTTAEFSVLDATIAKRLIETSLRSRNLIASESEKPGSKRKASSHARGRQNGKRK